MGCKKIADTIYVNGYIYTGVKNKVVSSVAVKNGKILKVGSVECVKKYQGENTEIIDLFGKMMLPGFVAGHMHPSLTAVNLVSGFDAYGSTIDEIKGKIEAFATANPDLPFLNGFSMPRSSWVSEGPLAPTYLDLDAIPGVNGRPLCIGELAAHSVVCNKAWLDILDLDASYPYPTNPPNGSIERFPAGDPNEFKPTGWLNENAQTLQTNLNPFPEKLDFQATFLEILNTAFSSAGVTAYFDAMNSRYCNIEKQKILFDWINELAVQGKLPCEVNCAWYINPADLSNPPVSVTQQIALANQYSMAYTSPLFRPRTTKFFVDGVFEIVPNGSALRLEPYSDAATSNNCTYNVSDPEYYGLDFWGDVGEDLTAALAQANSLGLQIHIHGIGDGGVRKAVDSIEAAGIPKSQRPCIAHLETSSIEDQARMAALGISATITPNWSSMEPLDTVYSNQRIGFDNSYRGMHFFQSLFDNGVNVSIGSDYPIAPPDYNFSTYMAMCRVYPPNLYELYFGDQTTYPYNNDLSIDYNCTDFENPVGNLLFPIVPERPNLGDVNDQRVLPIDRVIYASCTGGAVQMLRDKHMGTIEKCKDANFVIWDTNWFDYASKYMKSNSPTDLEKVSTSKVVSTIFKGKQVYPAPEGGSATRKIVKLGDTSHMHCC
jgi:predicted amidohydrolase YtcJ